MTLSSAGLLTIADDFMIKDGGTIGVASDADAITIASNGQLTLTQTLIGTALDISGDIDVDGTTNLDVVDIDGAVDMASTLQVDGAITSSAGATITVTDNSAVLTLVSTSDNNSLGPRMDFKRDSSSPADNDDLGYVVFSGENSADEVVLYAQIFASSEDVTDGTEDGSLNFHTISAGANKTITMVDGGINFADNGKAIFGAGSDLQIYHDGSDNYFNGTGDDNFLFLTNGGEKLRIRNGGFLRASNNLNVASHSRLSATTAHVFHSHTDGSIMFFYENTQADPYGYMIDFSQAAPDDNTNHFAKFEDSSAERCIIFSDGDVKNHDNSYGSLSDERIKDNITDANSQWDDIKALKVRNFQLKDDIRQYGTDNAKSMIGVIAQEVETAGMNGLVKHADPNKGNVLSDSTFGTVYKDGDDIPDDKAVGDVKEIKEKVKGVSYSVLYMKAIKALQEAMTRIETLESSNTALAARIKTLEDA